jgi:opacity protein-like surface antigen
VKHIGLLSLFLLPLAGTAFAQRGFDREQSFEFGVGVADTGSLGVIGIEGARLDVKSDLGLSVWGGYNFGEHFALLGELTMANPGYTATRVLQGTNAVDTIDANLDMSMLQVKGVYNILKGRVTPFVELGAGWTHLDSNLVQGPGIVNCWFDPFFGFVCRQFYDTYQDTRPTFSASAGVRWDVTDRTLLRASFGQTRIDTDNNMGNHIDIDTARIAAAWKFGPELE